MFNNIIRQLFILVSLAFITSSCDNHSHGPHDDDGADGLVVSGNDTVIARVEVEPHDDEDNHDDHGDDDNHADIGGFELVEEGQEAYTFRQLDATQEGSISLTVGETKEFSLHFLDDNGDELHEDEHCDDIVDQTECNSSDHCEWDSNDSLCEEHHCDDITDQTECNSSDHCEWDSNDSLCEDEEHEEHGMHIEMEGLSVGTTSFQVFFMHDGHADYTSLPIPISVTVE